MASRLKQLKKFLFVQKLQVVYIKLQVKLMGEKKWESKRFEHYQGYKPNLDTPKTLNEKIAWLKLNYIEDVFYKCCDKYLVHSYLKEKLGKDYAPKLLYVTQSPEDLTFDNIGQFPCIIKTSNGSGTNLIVKSREQYSEKQIQRIFREFIVRSDLHTTMSLEHQYDLDHPYIVVEELLDDGNGGIPNDYKFLYINGQLEFIYCSVDRLGANVRHVYDSSWNRLHFAWVQGADEKIFNKYDNSASIAAPVHFEEMKVLSQKLAKDFPLVRIDFYETKDDIYIGEITLHHGSGHDSFYPEKYDMIYGDKLNLPAANRL